MFIILVSLAWLSSLRKVKKNLLSRENLFIFWIIKIRNWVDKRTTILRSSYDSLVKSHASFDIFTRSVHACSFLRSRNLQGFGRALAKSCTSFRSDTARNGRLPSSFSCLAPSILLAILSAIWLRLAIIKKSPDKKTRAFDVNKD